MANQSTTTFLTGSTGFIGQYVLRGLLDGGQRVVVLLRGPAAQSRLRLAALLAPLGVDVPQHIDEGRLSIMEGTLPDALSAVTVGRVDRIVHSAACLQTVNADPGEPFDMKDVVKTTEQLYATTVELRAIIEDLESGAAQDLLAYVDTASRATIDHAVDQTNTIVDRLTVRVFYLIGVLLVALVTYRFIAVKLIRTPLR